VRSGQVCEKTLRTIGLSTIFFLAPATLSVNMLMLFLTSFQSVNFFPGISSKTPHGVTLAG
jgi:hypothetical protein